MQFTPREVSILGKGQGATHVTFWFEDGQTAPVHSISAGLDYPGVGPEHSYWKETGRVKYTNHSDDEAIEALLTLCRTEGIIPALESAHAVAEMLELAPKLSSDKIVLVNLSGRGDKDCNEIEEILKRRRPADKAT